MLIWGPSVHDVGSIKGLGFEVSVEKTEALRFCSRADRGTPPAGYRLRLGGMEVEVGTRMKYMGYILDNHWTFGVHL